jgi:glutamate carboxypeptidase
MEQIELHTQVEAFLENRLSDYLGLLQQMVDINSFTANPRGVNALGRLTADVFSRLGFQAESVPSAYPEYGDHLVLTRPGSSSRKIGFVSHLDTVFPPEEERRNDFKWRVEGDRAYGPGTVDIKGGTVLIYMILEALARFFPELYQEITWVLLLDASEEAIADDFGALCRRRLPAAETLACLVFEGGYKEDDKFWLVRCRKGMAVYEVDVEGKAAHAGTAHEQGANAIVQLSHIVQKLADMTDYQRQVTINVGVIAGGTVTNRVPHHATAALEMRTFEPAIYDSVIEEIASLNGHSSVSSANGEYPCRVTVNLKRQTAPWPPNEATDRLISIWAEAAAPLGYRIVRENRGGLSDGNHFWDVFPTLDGLGVAGGNAHCSERSPDGSKDQEYCQISSFVPKAVLNIMGIRRLVEMSQV